MKTLLIILTWAALASAQTSTGTIFGSITDESGSAIVGAKVMAEQEGTGFRRATLTNGSGEYRIEELSPGRFSISAQHPGFQTAMAPHVTVEVRQQANLDLHLRVGEMRETVDVVAKTSGVETEDSAAGYRFDSALVTQLPLDERNVIALVTLGPGAVPRQLGGFVHDVDNDIQQGSRGSVALNPPVNGARPSMNSYLMDGADNTDRNAFAIVVTPPLESVQEFRIQSSLAPPGFVQSGGGLVDLVTRSGGRSLHGSAFEYLRNEATDARNYFDDPTLERPIFRRNQYGAALGGPLPLASTYFFVAYEGLREKSATPSLQLVPDAAMRSGDFTAGAPIFDPLSAAADSNRAPFPGNIIPASRIDSIARNYLATYEPLPNRPDNPSSNYLDATPSTSHHDSGSLRLDRQFRHGGLLFGRYTVNDDRGGLGGAFPLRPTSEKLRAQQVAVGYTLAGASWVNEVRAAFNRLRLFDAPLANQNIAASLGIPAASSDAATFGLPYFFLTDFSTVTDDPTLPQMQRDNTWTVSDAYSLVHGAHTFKVGGSITRFQLNYLQSNNIRGLYTYTGAYSGNGDSASGDALADFLLGSPQRTERSVGDSQAYLRQSSYSIFAEHDWRASSRLTLTMALRYDYFAPFTEARNRLLNLDYSTLPQAPRLVPVSRAFDPNRTNFSPRIGLAWRIPCGLSGETVFRAGYGVYFSPELAVESYDLALNNVRHELNSADGATLPAFTTANGFPTNSNAGFPSYFGLDAHLPTPYVHQWNAGFQRELPGSVVLEAAYIGSKGTHLGRFRRFNTALHTETGENLDPRPGDLQSLRTFPTLGPIFQRQHIANSSYHSLQLKAEKRFAGSLSFLASFVWAKSIDDATSVVPGLFDSAGAQDERNLQLERGLSFFNVGRRISAGVVYRLPGPSAARVLRGWEISSVLTIQDGTPLDPLYSVTDIANAGTFNRPDVVPGQSISLPSSQRTPDHWFNTAAFADPAPFHFGNAGRDIIPGPGNEVIDFSLHKRFQLSETAKIEVRAETFNSFNHPNFGIPAPYPDLGPFFGKILTAGQPRRIQFATRIEF
jgi:hypothetical protein